MIWQIDFNGISANLELFYAQRLENCVDVFSM